MDQWDLGITFREWYYSGITPHFFFGGRQTHQPTVPWDVIIGRPWLDTSAGYYRLNRILG
jgi:hypothetical protein